MVRCIDCRYTLLPNLPIIRGVSSCCFERNTAKAAGGWIFDGYSVAINGDERDEVSVFGEDFITVVTSTGAACDYGVASGNCRFYASLADAFYIYFIDASVVINDVAAKITPVAIATKNTTTIRKVAGITLHFVGEHARCELAVGHFNNRV